MSEHPSIVGGARCPYCGASNSLTVKICQQCHRPMSTAASPGERVFWAVLTVILAIGGIAVLSFIIWFYINCYRPTH